MLSLLGVLSGNDYTNPEDTHEWYDLLKLPNQNRLLQLAQFLRQFLSDLTRQLAPEPVPSDTLNLLQMLMKQQAGAHPNHAELLARLQVSFKCALNFYLKRPATFVDCLGVKFKLDDVKQLEQALRDFPLPNNYTLAGLPERIGLAYRLGRFPKTVLGVRPTQITRILPRPQASRT